MGVLTALQIIDVKNVFYVFILATFFTFFILLNVFYFKKCALKILSKAL